MIGPKRPTAIAGRVSVLDLTRFVLSARQNTNRDTSEIRPEMGRIAAPDGIGRCRRPPKPGARPTSIQADRDLALPVRLMDGGRLSGRARTFEVMVWHIVV